MTRTELLKAGMKALIEKLGREDAYNFIAIFLGEPFDYTKHRHLFLYDEGDENLTAAEFEEKLKSKSDDYVNSLPPIGRAFKDPAIMAKLKAACNYPADTPPAEKKTASPALPRHTAAAIRPATYATATA